MSEYREIPDVEKALIAGFMDDDVLKLVVPSTNISSELPHNFKGGKYVRLYRTTGQPVDAQTETIDRALVQVDCFGAKKSDAMALAKAISVAIKRLEGKETAGVFVSTTDRYIGPQWAPDEETDIPRYFFVFAVTAHS